MTLFWKILILHYHKLSYNAFEKQVLLLQLFELE